MVLIAGNLGLGGYHRSSRDYHRNQPADRSLYSFLAVECLIIENYRKGVRTFRNGLITTSFGVALAIFGDLIGLEAMIFR